MVNIFIDARGMIFASYPMSVSIFAGSVWGVDGCAARPVADGPYEANNLLPRIPRTHDSPYRRQGNICSL